MSDREAVGHRPVLLDEAVDALNIRPDGCYVDGTFGRGGHSGEILRRLGPTGRLIAMDRDPEAIAHARQRFGDDPRFSLQPGAFSSLGEVCRSLGVSGEVDGILLDLGVSSPQLDDPARGFSFQADGPLDMRMDPSAGQSAAEWLNRAKEDDIAQVLRDYGEERFAKRIARAIVRERQAEPFLRSARLAAVISSANPKWERDKHPATRSFSGDPHSHQPGVGRVARGTATNRFSIAQRRALGGHQLPFPGRPYGQAFFARSGQRSATAARSAGGGVAARPGLAVGG